MKNAPTVGQTLIYDGQVYVVNRVTTEKQRLQIDCMAFDELVLRRNNLDELLAMARMRMRDEKNES